MRDAHAAQELGRPHASPPGTMVIVPMPSCLTAVFCLASLSRPEQALVILEPCRPDQPPLSPPLQNSPLLFGRRLTSNGIVRLRK